MPVSCTSVVGSRQRNQLAMDSVVKLLAMHPKYAEDFESTRASLYDESGPLAPSCRHFVALMAACRHRCQYLIKVHRKQFCEAGGDPTWLDGISRAPQKFRDLDDINKKLAHRPWELGAASIKELTKAGSDNWSLPELLHAMVLLCQTHSLCSFVLGCGCGDAGSDEGSLVSTKSTTPSGDISPGLQNGHGPSTNGSATTVYPENEVEQLLARLNELSGEKLAESSQEDRLKQFLDINVQSSETTVCTQPQQSSGGCGGAVQSSRYYFQPSSMSCQAFTYAGCGGNDNNFVSINDCQSLCLPGACPAGSPLLNGNSPQSCTMSFGASCPSGFDCITSRYGMGQQICCPSKNVCLQPLNQGTFCSSGRQQSRYYYNNGFCMTFTFLGCGGGSNNFATLQDCQSFCSGITTSPVIQPPAVGNDLCPNGQIPYVNPFTRARLACLVGGNNCPTGYLCAQIGFNTGCCLGTSFISSFPPVSVSLANVCPTVLTPLLTSLGQPRTCSPGVFSFNDPNSCPPPSQCFTGPAGSNRYYCCQSRLSSNAAKLSASF